MPVLSARAFANLPADKRDEGAGLFNLTKTLGFSFGTTAVGSLYYSGQLSNWTRFVGDITPSNPALTQYLDGLGSAIDYDGQMAYVASLLLKQSQLLTIFEIAEYLAVFNFGLLILAFFFGEKGAARQRGLAARVRSLFSGLFRTAATYADSR